MGNGIPLIVAMQMLRHMTNYLASSCAGELLRPSEAETPIPNSANTDGDADPAYIALYYFPHCHSIYWTCISTCGHVYILKLAGPDNSYLLGTNTTSPEALLVCSISILQNVHYRMFRTA